MNKMLALFVLALAGVVAGWGQNRGAIDIKFDKKVIYMDSLGFSENMSINGVLRLLPELLSRPGDATLYDNYDVQYDDVTLGSATAAALLQISVGDIEKIEVCESPVASYNHNGQGGSINLVPRSSAKQKDVWGKAALDLSYRNDVKPYFQINMQDPKLKMRGLAFAEYYNGEASRGSSTDMDYFTQLARVYVDYRISPKDVWKLRVSETTSSSRNEIPMAGSMAKVDKNKSANILALTNYEHAFNAQSKFVAEVQYTHSPNKVTLSEESEVLSERSFNNTISGKLEYKVNLLPVASKDYANLTVGVTGNRSFNNQTKSLGLAYMGGSPYRYETDANTSFLMPYFNVESVLGCFNIKAIAEYQHYEYDVTSMAQDGHKKSQNDFTGKFIFAWQMDKSNRVRLILDRKLQRPSSSEIYPYLLFNPNMLMYVEGNSGLVPMLTHEASLDYVSNHQWDDKSLTFNAKASYMFVNDIVNAIAVGGSSSGGLGTSLRRMTYSNDGHNHIWSGNLMAFYRHKQFSLSVAGNIYNNRRHQPNIDDNYTYYNISVVPAMSFSHGWSAYLNGLYFSRVSNSQSTMPHCLMGVVNVSKQWRQWLVYGYAKLADSATPNSVGLGASYSF